MISDVLGVVLAGGKSRRMGRDKSAIEIGGVSMLSRAVDSLSEVFDSVVIAGDSTVDIATVVDVIPHGGPLSGLDAVYRDSGGRALFVLAVDLPFVDAEIIRVVVGSGVASHGAKVPVTHGRMQPLCGLYGSELGGLVREHLESDDRSMFGFIASIEQVELVEMDPAAFENVNTAEELASAIKRFGPPRNTH